MSVVRVHERVFANALRERWRATFASPHADWARTRYDWDLLGTAEAPALEGRTAARAFDARRTATTTAFVTTSFDSAVLEVAGPLPDHTWWRQLARNDELVVIHPDLEWSYVLTHEEQGMGIGPYFVERTAWEVD